MNKSYSKIRSIQNTNLLLEQRYLEEKNQLTKLVLEHDLDPDLTGEEYDGEYTQITSYWDEWQKEENGTIRVNMRVGTPNSGNGKLWFTCSTERFIWDEPLKNYPKYKGKTYINKPFADYLKNQGLCTMQRNMAGTKYWDVLVKVLKNFGFTGIKNDGKVAYVGKLVIYRDKMDGDKKVIAEINGIKAYLIGKPYAGQQDLTKVAIESTGTDGSATLGAWLDVHAKQYKTATGGTTTKDVGGGALPLRPKTGGGKTGTIYKNCTGTYKKDCKSETIKKVQGCLSIGADGKFGSGTETAIFQKLGKKEFTDADVATLCAGKDTGGGATPPVGGGTQQGGTTQVELPEF